MQVFNYLAKMKHPIKGLLCNDCFLLFLLCVTAIHCFVPVIQTPNSTFKLVNSQAEITCTLKSRMIDQLIVFWYRKMNVTGETEFIMSSTSLGRSLYNEKLSNRNRFSITREHFQRMFVLKIQNLEYSDTGVYYCMVEEALKIAIGSGTALNVVDRLPTVAPTLKPTTSRPPCMCQEKTRRTKKGSNCSTVVWAPLAGCAGLLMISLGYFILHTHRVYVRSRQFFRKHLAR